MNQLFKKIVILCVVVSGTLQPITIDQKKWQGRSEEQIRNILQGYANNNTPVGSREIIGDAAFVAMINRILCEVDHPDCRAGARGPVRGGGGVAPAPAPMPGGRVPAAAPGARGGERAAFGAGVAAGAAAAGIWAWLRRPAAAVAPEREIVEVADFQAQATIEDAAMQARMRALEAEIADLRAAAERGDAQAQAALRAAREDQDALRRQLDDLRAALAALQERASKLQGSNVASQAALAAARREAERLAQELEGAQAGTAAERAEKERLRKKLILEQLGAQGLREEGKRYKREAGKDIQRLARERSVLRDQLKQASEELSRQIADARERSDALTGELEKTRQEMGGLLGQIAQLKADAREREAYIAQLENAFRQSQELVGRLWQQVNALRYVVDQHENTIAQLQYQLIVMEIGRNEERQDLEGQVNELVAQLRDAYELLGKTRAEAQDTQRDNERLIAILDAQVSDAQAQAAAARLREQEANVQTQLVQQALDKMRADLEAEKAARAQDAAAAQEAEQQAQAALKALTDDIATMQRAREFDAASIQKLRYDVEDARNRARLASYNAGLERELARQRFVRIGQLEEEVNQLGGANRELQAQLTTERQEAQAQLDAANDQFARAQAQTNQVRDLAQKAIADLIKQKDNAQAQTAAVDLLANKALAELRIELDRVIYERAILEAALASARGAFAASQNDLANVRTQLADAQAGQQELLAQIAAARLRAAEYERAAQEAADATQRNLDALTKRLQDRVNQEGDKLRARLTAERAAAQQALEAAQQQLRDAQAAAADVAAQRTELIARLEADKTNLAAQLAAAELRQQEAENLSLDAWGYSLKLQQDIEELKAQVAALQGDKDAQQVAEAELKRLQSKLKQNDKQIASLKDAKKKERKNKKALIDKLKKTQDQKARELEQIGAERDAIAQERDAIGQELANLRMQLAGAVTRGEQGQAQRKELQNKINELQTKEANIRNRATVAEEKEARLIASLQQAETRAEKAEAGRADAEKSLEQERKERLQEQRQRQQETDRARKAFEATQKELAAAQADVARLKGQVTRGAKAQKESSERLYEKARATDALHAQLRATELHANEFKRRLAEQADFNQHMLNRLNRQLKEAKQDAAGRSEIEQELKKATEERDQLAQQMREQAAAIQNVEQATQTEVARLKADDQLLAAQVLAAELAAQERLDVQEEDARIRKIITLKKEQLAKATDPKYVDQRAGLKSELHDLEKQKEDIAQLLRANLASLEQALNAMAQEAKKHPQEAAVLRMRILVAEMDRLDAQIVTTLNGFADKSTTHDAMIEQVVKAVQGMSSAQPLSPLAVNVFKEKLNAILQQGNKEGAGIEDIAAVAGLLGSRILMDQNNDDFKKIVEAVMQQLQSKQQDMKAALTTALLGMRPLDAASTALIKDQIIPAILAAIEKAKQYGVLAATADAIKAIRPLVGRLNPSPASQAGPSTQTQVDADAIVRLHSVPCAGMCRKKGHNHAKKVQKVSSRRRRGALQTTVA